VKHPSHVSLLTLTVATGAVWVCLGTAAEAPGSAFHQLRADWKSAVIGRTKNLRDGYLRKLRELEQQYAGAGDYAAAAQARRERLRVSGESLSRPASAPEAPEAKESGQPAVLEMAAAQLAGGLTRSEGSGDISGWAAGATARWALPPGLPAAGYMLELTAAPDPAGGTIQISEDFYTLSHVFRPGAAAEGGAITIGPLRLSAGSRTLTLTGTGLTLLKSLRLLPPQSPP
jgi:hypothetical protein